MANKCQANQATWNGLVQLVNSIYSVAISMDSKMINGVPTVSYCNLNRWLKTKNISVGADRQVGSTALDCIEQYCITHKIPDLTALVVHNDKYHLPGEDFFNQNGIPIASQAQLFPQWLCIARQVLNHRSKYPTNPPVDLCQFGNCR